MKHVRITIRKTGGGAIMTRQLSRCILFLAIAVLIQMLSSNSIVVPAVAEEVAVATSSNIAIPQDAHELSARLTSHVAAQVNKLLSEKNLQGTDGKVELKINLPADLATLVNSGNGRGALKFHRKENGELGDLKEIVNDNGIVYQAEDAKKNAEGRGGDDDDAGIVVTATPSAPETPCPLDTYSETGYATEDVKCEQCPEGKTTLEVGSKHCVEMSDEDILAILYDVVNGDSWSETHRRGWKSDLPKCEWEGISCNEDGDITAMAIPLAAAT